MKKIILLVLVTLLMIGCDMAMESLYVVNGTKYIIKSKTKEDRTYRYRLLRSGTTWYEYDYRDTRSFEVGDTLTITVVSAKSVERQ